ncbi:11968_t:CDS:2, partial [Funneliformis geosporum]
MNTNESSNSSSSKKRLQQTKLDYFGIANNFVQGKEKSTASNTVIQSENLLVKRTRDENTKQKIVEILQNLKGLSGKVLLKKILEDKSYDLFGDNKH